MAIPSSTDIVNIINVGPYNLTFEFFDYKQLDNRRHYPSIEVFINDSGASDRTKQKDIVHSSFTVRIFQKIQSNINEEDANQRQAEKQLITLLEAAVLADHRIVVETETLKSMRILERHPYFYVSELTISIRSAKTPSLPLDGILVFDATNSSVDNPPISNYTYTACYDTLVSDGYREIHEYVTSNPDGDKWPVPFAGGFNGRIVTNAVVGVNDIGTTGDKLNKLKSLRSNGEKPTVVFIYTNKTNESPTPHTITESGIKFRVDSVDRVYNNGDNVIYRIIGRLIAPSSISVS